MPRTKNATTGLQLTDADRTRLVEARQKTGLTQSDLAAQIRVNRVHLAECENGRRGPSADMLDRWCGALGLAATVETRIKITRA